MGYLQVVPDSHLLGPLETENFGNIPVLKQKDWTFTEIEMDLGDVLVFHNLTVHKSGNNISEMIRLTAHFRYNDLQEKSYINRGYPRNRTNE